MERRHGADFAFAGVERVPAPARLGDAFLDAEQGLRRWAAEADENVGIDEFDLAPDERQADRRLLRRRRAVAGRPPGHDVGDVDFRAVEADRRQHAVEQFAGTADEGQALDVFVAAGRFADEHHARLRIAVGEYQLRRGRLQRAAVEFLQNGAQLVERLGAFCRFARGHGGLVRRLRRNRRAGAAFGFEVGRKRNRPGARGPAVRLPPARNGRPAARRPGHRPRLPGRSRAGRAPVCRGPGSWSEP